MVKRPSAAVRARRRPRPRASKRRARRAEKLVEESREHVVVLDADRGARGEQARAPVAGGSRRRRAAARAAARGEREGRDPLEIEYEVDGARETLVYLGTPGDLAAYQELRAGFTAAVSHELRTPLARLMVLLDSLALPGADADALAAQARAEVEQIGELIDDVLFLSELESGRAVVSLGSTPALPVLEEIVAARAERSANAGVALHVDCPAELEVPLRPRMLETIAANLVDNALRYAVQVQRSRFARTRRVTRSSCQAWTAATACRTKTCRACSSASSAPTARVPRTAPASASPSSSTSSPRQAARPRRERCRAAASRSAASSRGSCNQIVTGSSPPRRPAALHPWQDSRAMKRLALAAALLCALLVGAGCGGGGGSQTILADGSSTVGPYTTRAAENFKQENADVEVTVGISGTGGGFERFCQGETDLSNASRPIDEEDERGAGLRGRWDRVPRAARRKRRPDGRR